MICLGSGCAVWLVACRRCQITGEERAGGLRKAFAAGEGLSTRFERDMGEATGEGMNFILRRW